MNYDNIERDFIERTLAILEQYYKGLDKYPPEERYNHTLLINCMLGIIILPNQKHVSLLPNEKLLQYKMKEYGLGNSRIGESIKTTRDLVIQMRNSVAHFDIKCIPTDDEKWIKKVVFYKDGNLIIEIDDADFYPFVQNIGKKIIQNIDQYNKMKRR